MLYKVLCAALLVASGEALKISAGVSRREAVAKAASVALPFVIAPAFAEEIKYKRAGDANIYARADAGTLTAERAIKRAKSGDLADGSSATCEELDRLINIDRESAAFENEMLDIADGKEAKDLTATRDKLNKQVERLKKKKQDKGC